eukprot:gene22418-27268_t
MSSEPVDDGFDALRIPDGEIAHHPDAELTDLTGQ